MRLGTVIGRVTLSVKNPRFTGERLLLTLPWTRETLEEQAAGGEARTFAPAIVVYDTLGGGVGQTIGISESREAANPFPQPTPVDAYCAALIDHHFYTPKP